MAALRQFSSFSILFIFAIGGQNDSLLTLEESKHDVLENNATTNREVCRGTIFETSVPINGINSVILGVPRILSFLHFNNHKFKFLVFSFSYCLNSGTGIQLNGKHSKNNVLRNYYTRE